MNGARVASGVSSSELNAGSNCICINLDAAHTKQLENDSVTCNSKLLVDGEHAVIDRYQFF